MKRYSLKHLFYWVFVICILLGLLRIPVGWFLANFEFYYFFQPLWYFWGWVVGFSPNFTNPVDIGDRCATAFGVIATVISIIVSFVLLIKFLIDIKPR